MNYRQFDIEFIHFARRTSVPLARFSIFLVFFWFGTLKVLGLSPASGMVHGLLTRTMPFVPSDPFLVGFGIFEALIGILFLIKGFERIVIPLLFVHLAMTVMPLFLMTSDIWLSPFVPSLEGQYIIKNIFIVAVAIGIAAHLHPIKAKR